MSPEDRFERLVEALLDQPGITPPEAGGKFGSNGLKVKGHIFAMLVRGSLVVKLPRKRVDELVGAGEGRPFEPGTGRVMKEWLALSPDSKLDWLALSREALRFVGPPSR